jgi:hypothetical protein
LQNKVQPESICFPAVSLQRKIHFVVFAKIQGFGFGRDALTGIVFEFPALPGIYHHAFFDAKELILAHGSSIGTIGAGLGHLLSEQHGSCPLNH